MNTRIFLGVVVTAAVALGCAPRPVQPRPVEPAPAVARDDAAIGEEVRRRLTALGGEMVGVVVDVSGGDVVLRGSIGSAPAAWRAEAAVRAVNGVRAVRNALVVRGLGLGY